MGRLGLTRNRPTPQKESLTPRHYSQHRMKVHLLLLGCLLCLRLSAGFIRGAHMVLGNARGRSPYSSGRGYGRQSYLEDGGGRQMGGMGFGKRGSADYYSPEELQDSEYDYGDQEQEEEEEEDIPGTLRYLQLLEDYARILNQEKGNEEKRGMASLARINSSIGSATKRGMASLARINSNGTRRKEESQLG